MSEVIRQIELLAPAKDYDSAVDAIDCGADAVYIGAARFGARYAAGNSVEDIARVVDYAHLFGVKVYATCNTLLFEEELDEARRQAEALVAAGVDALIVQDMAYCRMGLPIELHASTQTNCASAERVRFFEQVGFSRAILERSLSRADIEAIHRDSNIELEAFVHGAICVSQSGRCFMSRSCSTRSGNRGECSQPCRQTYDLTNADGEVIIKGKHLLSVRDLDLSAHIGELIDAGIGSLKIEGRLKDRLYLRNTVSHYRRLLDEQIALRPNCRRASEGVSRIEFDPDPSKSFTRGFTDYFFAGKRAGVVSFDTPKSIGEYVGRVKSVDGRSVTLDRATDLATGDGVCFVADGGVVGANVNGVEARRVMLNREESIKVGAEVYRNYNRLFANRVERSRLRRSVEIDIRVNCGQSHISLTAVDGALRRATVAAEYEGAEAKNGEKMLQTLRDVLSKSGDSCFDVRSVEVDELRFVPASLLASLRRELLDALAYVRREAFKCGGVFVEQMSARYPSLSLTEQDNVTNSLARAFYADHGVEQIDEGLDCRASTEGCRVMVSDYCVRREIGQCLLEKPTLRGDLFLERGRKRYRIACDCKKCQMSLYDCL